ncbi:sigma factor G inhibitor Gin [Clostridioides difficile]
MNINNKDIWRDMKKYCIICEKECDESGIQIMNSFICENCVQRMNVIDVDTEEYEMVKDKIKKAISEKIYNPKIGD